VKVGNIDGHRGGRETGSPRTGEIRVGWEVMGSDRGALAGQRGGKGWREGTVSSKKEKRSSFDNRASGREAAASAGINTVKFAKILL